MEMGLLSKIGYRILTFPLALCYGAMEEGLGSEENPLDSGFYLDYSFIPEKYRW